MLQDFIMVLTTVLVIIGVIIFTYFTTRWMAGKMNIKSNTDNIKLVDNLMISPDKSIVIIEIAGKTYSLAMSQNYILKISEIDKDDITYPSNKNNSNFEVLLKDKLFNIAKSTIKKDKNVFLKNKKEVGLKDEDKDI